MLVYNIPQLLLHQWCTISPAHLVWLGLGMLPLVSTTLVLNFYLQLYQIIFGLGFLLLIFFANIYIMLNREGKQFEDVHLVSKWV